MRRILAVVVLSVVVTVGGCATAAKYEAILDSWMGSAEGELVSAWGPPINVYEAPDGTRILTFNSARNVYIPGQAPNYTTTVIGNTAYTNAVGGRAPMALDLSCATNFTVKNGKIISWRYQGNDCTAM
jgi:hypothetical protein